MSEWQIVGVSRETGQPETVYQGDDYSNVSDMMLNPGESSAEYAQMSLYEDGLLVEAHPQSLPGKGASDLGWWVFIVIVLVVLYILFH